MSPRYCLLPLLVLLVLLLAPLPAAQAASPVAPDTLADSTVVEHWTLENGLRVVTRHIPGGGAVAITVAYASGTDDDPPGREGLAQLLGHLVFTAPAGDIPERTKEDLDSQRPYGWSFPVSRRTTLLTEVASVEQLPGVLAQVAGRMRGVRVTPAALQTSLHDVRSELSQQLIGPPQVSLYHQVREVALERKDEDILRRASGRNLGKLSVAEIQEQLGKSLVPANAVLALAGNLSRVEIHPLVRNLFGGIPGGTARSPRPTDVLKPGSRVLKLTGIHSSSGAVGVIAPALGDSAHPSFYLNTLLIGSQLSKLWNAKGAQGTPAAYHYAVLDEPDLVRVFPPVALEGKDPAALANLMNETLNSLRTMIVSRNVYEEIQTGSLWLLGGPMRPAVAARARREPMLLHSLARSMASRGLWGGEAFWKDYRERFAGQRLGGLGAWMEYFKDPRHQVVVMALPGATQPPPR